MFLTAIAEWGSQQGADALLAQHPSLQLEVDLLLCCPPAGGHMAPLVDVGAEASGGGHSDWREQVTKRALNNLHAWHRQPGAPLGFRCDATAVKV